MNEGQINYGKYFVGTFEVKSLTCLHLIKLSISTVCELLRGSRYLMLGEARKPKAKEAIQMPSTGNYRA